TIPGSLSADARTEHHLQNIAGGVKIARRLPQNRGQICTPVHTHAINAGLPPDVQNAYVQVGRLLTLLLEQERTLRQP
ncbi:MAG: hypothetical protein AB7L90_18480, partial [Hyphomicrobiaceae bacterium]